MKLHFTSGYHQSDGQLNKRTRLWNSTSESIATANKTIVQTPSISWVRLQQYSECHYQHYTLLCQQGFIIQTSQFILVWSMHLHMPTTLSQTSMSYTVTLATHSRSPTSYQTSADSQPTTSPGIQNWKPSICQGSIFPYNLAFRRNFQTNSLFHTKSLHPWHPFSHPYDSRTTSEQIHPVFHISMFEPPFLNPIQIDSTYTPTLIIEDHLNSKFPNILDTRLTTKVTANFNILSDGWAMKALTKNLCSILMSVTFHNTPKLILTNPNRPQRYGTQSASRPTPTNTEPTSWPLQCFEVILPVLQTARTTWQTPDRTLISCLGIIAVKTLGTCWNNRQKRLTNCLKEK